MSNPLPFELDRPELLEAAALALAAAAAHPPQPGRARPYAVWQRDGAGDVRRVPDAAPEAEAPDSWPVPAAYRAGRSAEDLSLEIERDARRFEAN